MSGTAQHDAETDRTVEEPPMLSTEEIRLLAELQVDEPDNSQERRQCERKAFLTTQSVAYDAEALGPERRGFFKVKCVDLSAGGFSYLTERRPPGRTLVAALQGLAGTLYLRAQFMHVRPTMRDGKPMYLVGCMFIERLKPSEVRRTIMPDLE